MPESENGDIPVEREAVEEFLRRCDAEQQRLRAEISAVHDRLARVDASADAVARNVETELGAIVLATHEELTRLEQTHREAIQAIRDRSLAEAARLLDDARSRAEDVRARAARLLSQPGEEGR